MQNSNDEKSRNYWTDLVRLLAMLIVMMNHAGLVIKGVNFWGGMFYVPVFFVLSGFYWKREVVSIKDSLRKKAKRLLFPFLLVNAALVLLFLAASLIKGDFSGAFLRTFGFLYGRNQLYLDGDTLFGGRLFVLPGWENRNLYFMTALNSPTWFLPALFLTMFFAWFLYVAVLHQMQDGRETQDLRERFAMHRVIIMTAILMPLGIIWHYITPLLLPWSIDALPIFMVLFFIGHLLGQWGGWEYLTQRPWYFAVFAVFLVIFGLMNGSANFSVGVYGNSIMLGYVNAVTASLVIMYLCYLVRKHIPRILAYAGSKTLSLLCWHYPCLVFMERIREKVLPGDAYAAVIKLIEIVLTIVLICLCDEVFNKLKLKFCHEKRSKEQSEKQSEKQ